ncbi:MAG: hypothetical protein ACP5GX_05860 [Anaerolineae bacterium]
MKGVPASLPSGPNAGPCETWVQVNDDAFGMDDPSEQSPPYDNEEGFEVIVFEGSLYVGMEADNAYGARLWRTRPGVILPQDQSDWEEVAEENGEPFGNPQKQNDVYQNDHIDSLAVFKGILFASTANGGSTRQGTMIYASTTGASGSWKPVITAGFGYTENTNFKDMQVFEDWLCGGTQNQSTGAQVWCTNDGISWMQKNHGGFGTADDDPTTIKVWSGYVYSGSLYFGAQNSGNTDDLGLLFRTDDIDVTSPTWTQVYTGVSGSGRVDILGQLGDYFYISTAGPNGIRILRSQTGKPGSWELVNEPGMDGDASNLGTVVDGATTYNGALYVSVSNGKTVVEVWRTTGRIQDGGPRVDWAQVGASGLGDSNNYYAELIPYNGYLYAWTSNYETGQEVRRTACPIQQAHAVTGAGTYEFSGAGATITLTAGALDVLTVSVYPGGFPAAQTKHLPIARHYAITHTPVSGVFTADLTLAYTAEELAASDADTFTLYLTRWNGQSWVACPSESRERDADARTVTCRDVSDFSTWAFASVSGSPAPVYTFFLPILTMAQTSLLTGLAVVVFTLLITRFKIPEVQIE